MILVAGCVALAALSLFLPSEPSFDPWAWIVWGREVYELELDTTAGPSWKPLPVLFTTAFAAFGEIDDGLPPALWLVVARAGALLSIVFAFRIARRLAGPGRWTGIGAGAVAAVLLAFAPQWLRYAAHGNEVPLAVTFMLAAADRHLDGHRTQALVLGFLACLLRPEVFPFLAGYAIWLWHTDRSRRWSIGGLTAALAALWLIPEWISTGNPFDAGTQAASEPPWSLSLEERPWLAAIERAHRVGGIPLELGAVVAGLFAVFRRDRLTLALFGVAVFWLALVAGMTQIGFSGSTRYFVPAIVIGCILTGLAAAWTVGTVGRTRPAAGVATAIVLALAIVPYVEDRGDKLIDQGRRSADLATLHRQMAVALRAIGGADRVAMTGPPSINRAFSTHLAWEAHLPIRKVAWSRGRALVFVTEPTPVTGKAPRGSRRLGHRGIAGRTRDWTVLAPTARRIVVAPDPTLRAN